MQPYRTATPMLRVTPTGLQSITSTIQQTQHSIFHYNQQRYMAVVSSGNYIYLVGDNFTVFNVSNPTNASIVGTAALPMAFSFYNRALVISGGYAYVGYWSGATIYTLGVQSPPPLAIT